MSPLLLLLIPALLDSIVAGWHAPNPAGAGRPDQVLLVQEAATLPQSGTYNQAIQLERGWNLVSWYEWPPDPTSPTGLTMDDLFNSGGLPWGPQDWFNSDYSDNPTDKVGRFDRSPDNPPTFYPQYGKDLPGPPWTWNLRQAYAIYLDTGAHFWEFTVRPLYNPPTPPPGDLDDDFSPNVAWDDYTQAGIPNTPERDTYWYFISYPKRSQLKLHDSNTISWLVNYLQNPVACIKDDAGRYYDPAHPYQATLEYLQPGRGYYLGFRSGAAVQDCPWFFNEGADPYGLEPSPKQEQPSSGTVSSASHFQFKSRTHWWYSIEIDTIAVDSLTPAVGDEIAVFCFDLCVGATVFEGQYPLYLAAWMDDIATPDSLDGYLVAQEMTFKWFDVSANQEITFTPPPETQAVEEADPYFPTHSGFGMGFCARRSLSYGIQSITQFPQEYSLPPCYPNPFNAQTVIPLELPQRSQVKIELFDVRGQNLGTIYEGIQNAGMQKIRFRAQNLASGMYFYRITAQGLEQGGQFQGTGKMLVLK